MRFRVLFALFACSAMFFIVAAIIFISENVVTSPVGWEKQSVISPAGVPARNVNVDKRGNLVACVFEGQKSGNSNIFLSVSFNGGTDFLKSRSIFQFRSSTSNNPRVTIDRNGVFYLCWYRLSDDGSTGNIYMSVSSDYGTTWSEAKKISFGMTMEILPSVYCDNANRIHLFFAALKGKTFNLFHSIMKSELVFGKESRISEIKGEVRGAFFPVVRFDSGHGVVIWQSKESDFRDHLYYTVSDNNGDSWSGVDKITTGKFNNQAPSFIIDDDTIYLAYINNSKKNWGIKLLKGYKYGSRWDDPIDVSTTNANCFSPDIVSLPSKELLITWHDSREKGNRIYYRKYSVPQRTMEDEKKLSFHERPGKKPVAIRSGGKVIVLWEESGRITVNRSDTSVASPVVFSKTHRDDTWTTERDAVVRWSKVRDESGIAGFATLVDNNPETSPTIQNYRYDKTEAVVNGLGDGITYFHIRAIDGAGNMSRTVHYRLMVSSNPLSMPVIVSPSHPEGKNSINRNALFRWAVNDSRRLKGFLYSLSKDKFETPNRILNDFSILFKSLEPGVYFFNLAAVSKTNQISRVSTYSFIVGTEGKLDPDYLKRIANRKNIFPEKRIVREVMPAVRIVIPKEHSGKIDVNSFEVLVDTSNISRKQVTGFALAFGEKKVQVPKSAGSEKPVFELNNINKGKYFIGARVEYYTVKDGKKISRWTEPVYRNIEVTVPFFINPFETYYSKLLKKIDEKVLLVLGFITMSLFLPLVLGYGNRFMFYFRSILHKMGF